MCAGYGGIGLGIKRILGERLRTIAYCELEGFAQANLISKMEKGFLDVAPIWSDLKTFPYGSFRGLVDILIAGYPCQPFSAAGKRAGKEDPRHLWPWIADGIRILRPKMCFFENVEGHISLGLREVIGELEELGYKVSWGIFSAREVGASHQRKRVFILAYDKSLGLEGLRECCDSQGWEAPIGHSGSCGDSWPSRPGEPQHAWEPPRVVGNAIHNAGFDVCGTQCGQAQQSISSDSGSMGNTSMLDGAGQTRGQWETQTGRTGATQHDRQAQPALGRDTHGSADWMDYAELYTTCDNRTDELRLLGNGVVPATAERAFRILMNELTTERNKQ